MNQTKFVYVSYISANQEKIWKALIDPEMTLKYWQHVNVSDWKPGSIWEHRQRDQDGPIDLVGKVVEFLPPQKLVLTWAFLEDKEAEEKHSKVTVELEPFQGVVRLTLTHEGLEVDSDMMIGITEGWPKVISSLKSLMEAGKPLPRLW